METKKMKMIQQPRDRISELPDALLLSTFEFMTVKDIVTTGKLSRRWKNVWTLSPFLNFVDMFRSLEEFRSFVSRCLLCWRGDKLQTLKLRCEGSDVALTTDMDIWLSFAVTKGLEKLDVCIDDYKEYTSPRCLYNCQTLQCISFTGSIRAANGVQWNNLKSLTLAQSGTITQASLHQVLTGSPILEEFVFTFRDVENNLKLSIRSSSLRVLALWKINPVDPVEVSMDTGLEICTPKLQLLAIGGLPYGTCELTDISSLTQAAIGLIKDDHVGVTLGEILSSIQHVEQLSLSTELFGVMISNQMLSPFPRVTHLKLRGRFDEHEEIVHHLGVFPELKSLLIEDQALKHGDPKNKSVNPALAFPANLKTVKVTWNMHDASLFLFLESLLRYSSKLETMVFRARSLAPPSDSPDSMILEAKRRLMDMPRSSRILQFIFPQM